MTRQVIPPNHSTATIDTFFGAVRDRSGIEIDKNEFYDLTNIDNVHLDSLTKRAGVIKYNSETHAAGASTKVNGLFDYVNDSGTSIPIKITQDGKIYKNTGSWAEITAGAPGGGFANANAFFTQLQTRKTGASADTTGTLTAADSTTVTLSSAAYTVNTHTGKVMNVNTSENKLIAANNATKFFMKERFDDVPTGTFNVYPRQQEFFFANGTDFYKCDGTTLTRLDNSAYAYAFTGITAHAGRVCGWKGTRLHFSDLGVGEHFSRNAWKDFSTTVQVAEPLKKILMIYEKKRVTAQFGDSPDNFYWEDVLDGIGTVAPKSVATYGNFQFFLSDEYGVSIISSERLSPGGGKSEPLSISSNYINTLILAHSASEMAAASAEVYKGKYILNIGSTWYVLFIEESLLAPRDADGNVRWIWGFRDYPSAIDANVLGKYGTSLVAGSASTGQVYTLDSGVTDDGTAITATLEKRDWQVSEEKVDKSFWSIKFSQPITASTVTQNVYVAPDSGAYGSAVASINLNTEASFEHEVKIPANPSDQKGNGKRISIKMQESGSVLSSGIEEIVLLYDPDILY